MKLQELTVYVDDFLNVAEIKDYPNALNGLQLENDGEVTKIAAAVDACEATIKFAAQAGANLLLVHHGLFWSGLMPVTGAAYRKLQLAMENDMAVYSAHLPLDAHPTLGNNALLCDAIGFGKNRSPFLGLGWQVEEEVNREVLHSRIEHAVGGAVHIAAGGPILSKRIGVVTGGAGGDIARAAAEGVDTFITGEGPHWSYTAAEELGVNLFYAGHYATETFGVRALAEHLAEKFNLEWEFIDHPTGL